VVMPIEQELKDYETAENPAKSLEGLAWRLPSSPYVDPPVVVLKVRKTVLKFANDFEFLDEDMANR
jgi:hypothetical protein